MRLFIASAVVTSVWAFWSHNGKADAADEPTEIKGKLIAPMRWRIEFDHAVETRVILEQEPEKFVRLIYAALGEGDRASALDIARQLALRFPTFQLGQLLYADLLSTSTDAPVPLPEVTDEIRPSLIKRLNDLLVELNRRISSPGAAGLADRRPQALLYLSPQQPFIGAVDASQSRIYWFENVSASPERIQLKLIKESYISVGINGVGKVIEGDGKTPTGIYFVQKNLPGETLPDLFGVGALTLNYPNAVDLMAKKTGSGIWLHGTPSDQYARAPESTDGCVVLSNPEMSQLLKLPNLRMTPVVIADKLDWADSASENHDWNQFKPALDSWLAARNGNDAVALKAHYSERFERDDMNLSQWWPRLAQTTLGYGNSKALQLISVLHWQAQAHTVVVTLKDPNQAGKNAPQYLRTYWQNENGQWKIVFQGPT